MNKKKFQTESFTIRIDNKMRNAIRLLAGKEDKMTNVVKMALRNLILYNFPRYDTLPTIGKRVMMTSGETATIIDASEYDVRCQLDGNKMIVTVSIEEVIVI